jgi:hypothetical protein
MKRVRPNLNTVRATTRLGPNDPPLQSWTVLDLGPIRPKESVLLDSVVLMLFDLTFIGARATA